MRKARSDREFLPAALSILETPPSPVKVWLIWAICGLFAFVIAWSYFGRIDIIAVAQGKIQPTGRVKTIQPVDGGKVVAIHVENGRAYRPGRGSRRTRRRRNRCRLCGCADGLAGLPRRTAAPDDRPGRGSGR